MKPIVAVSIDSSPQPIANRPTWNLSNMDECDDVKRMLIEKLLAEAGAMEEGTAQRWSASIVNDPERGSSRSPYPDMMLFDMRFERMDVAGHTVRTLRLWTSYSQLCSDPAYARALIGRMKDWLATSHDANGEIWCFAV